MKKRKEYDDDDGRVIAPMNVDGMPWYVRQKYKNEETNEEGLELNREERHSLYWGALKAALLVAGVFIVAFTLFILFCVFVWFK